MKKWIVSLALLTLFFVQKSEAASLVIDKFPSGVRAGDTIDVQLSWTGVPTDKDYVLRVQLENWDVNPGICIFKDVEKFSETGSLVVTLDVPKNTNKGQGCRILAAFLSKSVEWDDVLVVATTEKAINLGSLLNISNAPVEVQGGQEASVDVSWEGVPTNEGYKLVVQLENWDVKPGMLYLKEITSFQAKGSEKVKVSVPGNARAVAGCRFVAAFISSTEGWNKVFAVDRTEKNVSVKPMAQPQPQA